MSSFCMQMSAMTEVTSLFFLIKHKKTRGLPNP
jgi:hypothetical protein